MSEIKWIKIKTEIFDDEKVKLIDSMKNRDTIFYIWMRLLVQAGKTNNNGLIYLSEDISFDEEMLATIFNRSVEDIKSTISILQKFKMLEILDDGKISITNWEKHQNVEGMERAREQSKLRMRRKREKDKRELEERKSENLLLNTDSNNKTDSNSYVTSNIDSVTVTLQKERENKIENKIKNKIEREIEKEKNSSIDEINRSAKYILEYYENLTKVKGILSLSSLKVAVGQHGEKYVREAINKALQVNKMDMKYINGILKNWKKEGYPERVVNENGTYNMLSNGYEVDGFKPRPPKEITDEQRIEYEKGLI